MREAAAFLTQPFSRTLALALLHFLWQGALVALLLAAGNAILIRASARARYGTACAAMALMLALPALTVWRLAGRPANAAPGQRLAAPAERILPDSANEGALAPSSADRIALIAPWIVLGWLAGVFLLSIRFVGGFLAAQRLAHRSTRRAEAHWEIRLAELAARLRVSQPVRLLESALIEVPAAVGILRPVILLPAGIATGLSADQIDSLLAHELAHIRRRDCLMNLLQALAETLLFYHPAVWWVSHRVRLERENACDDLAVEVTGDAAAYARALVALEERRQPVLRLAMAASGGRLWNRVARLFPASEADARSAPRWMAAVLALGGVLALGAAARVPIPETRGQVVKASLKQKRTPEATPPAAVPSSANVEETPDREEPASTDSQVTADGLLSPQQLIAFRIHGVTPEFVGQIIALGYDKASPNDLLELRIHGVTPQYIAQMTAIFGKLPLEEYTAFRIHGLTPESLKELEASFGKLSTEDALAMRIHGVTPEFVQGFRTAGYGPLSAEDAVALRIHGVDPADAALWKGLKFGDPSIEDLLALRIHGVTPEFGRAMRSLGMADLSLDDLTAFRIHGVTPEYVREIRALGYTAISADDLVAFRIHGISPESIQDMNRNAGRRLSADDLIERRIHAASRKEKEVEP